jgi:hypothetical protein
MAFGSVVQKFELFLGVAMRTLGGRAPTASNEPVGNVSGLLLIPHSGTMIRGLGSAVLGFSAKFKYFVVLRE